MINIENINKELAKFKRFTFYEEPHIYTFKANPQDKEREISTSVTSLVHSYTNPFDAEKIAPLVARKEGVTKEVILSRWDFKRELACDKGTAIHAYMEWRFGKYGNYSYDKDFIIKKYGYDPIEPLWDKIKSVGEKFYQDYKDRLIPIGLELVLGSIDYDLAGCIDFLAYSKKLDAIIILDYKSNDKIKFEDESRGKKMLYPLHHIPDTNYYHYCLQLAIYKHLLEYETNLKVLNKKWLIYINEKHDNYKLYECLDLSKEAKMILDLRRKKINGCVG